MNKHVQTTAVIIGLGMVIIVVAIVWLVIRNGNNTLILEPTNTNNEQVVPATTTSNEGASPATGAVPTNLSNGQTVSLPLTINGTVPGNWFFEGSFPVFLKDANGTQIAVALAQTTEDWMTTNIIPFTVTLPAINYQGAGTVVFTKDNPSGEPQFDASVTVNVIFN